MSGPWDDFPSFVDPDAADTSPLDYIPTSRLRAEEAYDPDHAPNTNDPAVSEWELIEAHRIADANGGIVAASTLERRLRLGHSEAVRLAAIVNGEKA